MPLAHVMIPTAHITTAILILMVCYPLLRDQIPMNHWYGIRFKKSFESDENWYAINRFGAAQFIRWALVLLAIGVLGFALPLEDELVVIIYAILPALVLIPPCITSYRFAQKL